MIFPFHISGFFLINHTKATTMLTNLLEKALLRAFIMLVSFFISSYIGISVLQAADISVESLEIDRTVSGSVTDAETGDPMPGATVRVQGTNLGAVTNEEGAFSLSVPDDATTLLISYVGYKTLEVNIESGSQFDVQLEVDDYVLGQVVVTGYGTQRREDVTGAIGTVTDEEFNAGVIVSPEQLIQGKLAGVSITANNGEPGAAQTIIIRGPGSLRTGNGPLFVVDGVPLDDDNISPGRDNVGFGSSQPLNPLNFLNPNDIASIDVLKDASATAIYGARGANGVIMITTKRGTGQGGLNYSNYFGVSQAANKIELLNADEFIQFQNTKGSPDNIFNSSIDTDWQDEVFRDAFVQNHSLSFNGGSDQSNYYVSLSYLDQEGLIRGNELQRYTARVNFTQSLIEDRLRIKLNLTASHTDNEGVPRNDNADANFGSLIPDMLGGNPTYPVRDANGELFIFPNGRNPLADLALYTSLTRNDRILGNIEAALEIVEGLEYKVNFAMDRSVGNGDTQIEPSGLANIAIPEGAAVFSKTEANNLLIENYLQYDYNTGDHGITVLGGYSYQRFFNRFNSSSIIGFSTDEIDLIFAPQIGTILDINQNRPSGNATQNELQSFFGRVNYDFGGKYLLTATVRADGSSKFGENNRYGVFPSVAAAWKINEDLFPGSAVVTNLKLRAGWGQTGNQEIPGKITQAALTSTNSPTNGGYPLTQDINPGFTFTRTANPDIQWEVTTQTNVGLDFAFFGGSFYGSVDYFYKNTTDVLLNLTVSDPISPTASRWENIDMDIINQGVEIALNYQYQGATGFDWGLGANGTILSNEVDNAPFSFLRTGDVDGPGLSGVTVAGNLNGEGVASFFLLEHLGFDENGENIFRDANGDGTINADDRVVAGSPFPDFTYNFFGNVGFRGLSLTMNFNGAVGSKIYNNTANAYFNAPQLSSGTNIAKAYLVEEESAINSATESTRYLEDGDFLRLNNATLRYSFDVSGLSWIRGLALYVTGQNLFTITDYSGFDPEVNVPSDVGGVVGYGIDFANYPRARTYLGGIDISF